MATRMKAAGPATQAPPSAIDASASEHIYIGSDDLNPNPATAARTVNAEVALGNALRRSRTDLTLYEEGFLTVAEQRNGKAGDTFRLDLHYVDPVPTLERVVAVPWFYLALGCAGAAGLAAFLLRFDMLRVAAISTLGVAVLAALVALVVAVYRSYEKTEFCTLHGRAPVLRLVANLGSIKKFRAFVPVLCHAIEEAAERIGDDTSAYLRAEMREHYRLRGDGVLSNEACAEGTGRILAQFDIRL
jgi:hypothetical protein